MKDRIRVLVVDDSAFARKVIREVLSQDLDIEVVGIARDGLEALEKIAELKPDVITLDLLMPDLDGLGVLKALSLNPLSPRVIVVSVSGSNSDLAVEALESGAVDIVTKPTALPTDRLYDLATDLVSKVKAAAVARPRTTAIAQSSSVANMDQLASGPVSTRLIVIGTSTGGPQALTSIFTTLPKGLPVPIAIALHIPAGYTAPLAARLSKLSAVPVEEATDGMQLVAGQAVIAPGGMHLKIRESAGSFFAVVSREPSESLHHPSVDILFESAAHAAGAGTLALIMTGMGNDGFEGTKKIRSSGGRVIAESASSCVVYGMPRCVIEGGTANFEAPLQRLTELLVTQVYAR